jgi:uncharacterized protein (TIGR00290 family)
MPKTTIKPKAVMAWSSGKDSAYALWKVQQKGEYEIVSLFTTVSDETHRIPMHEVHEELLDRQAKALGLPLHKVYLDFPSPNPVYEEKMKGAIKVFLDLGVTHMIFGDLFLEDIRKYREKMLEGTGITPVFPLWGLDTRVLAKEMITREFKAVVTAVHIEKLSKYQAGRVFTELFVSDLPEGVDPCGENGEFHTFVFDAPNFSFPISFRVGRRFDTTLLSHLDLVP